MAIVILIYLVERTDIEKNFNTFHTIMLLFAATNSLQWIINTSWLAQGNYKKFMYIW